MNTPTKKQMTESQMSHFTGKRVNRDIWEIPDFYAVCEWTGKMYPMMDDVWVTWPHHAFTREERQTLKISFIEDATWLSEEGYDQMREIVTAAGLWHKVEAYYGL